MPRKIGICAAIALVILLALGTRMFVQNKDKSASEMCQSSQYVRTVVVCKNGDYIVNHREVDIDGIATVYDVHGRLLKSYGGLQAEKHTAAGNSRLSKHNPIGCDPYQAKVVCDKTK